MLTLCASRGCESLLPRALLRRCACRRPQFATSVLRALVFGVSGEAQRQWDLVPTSLPSVLAVGLLTTASATSRRTFSNLLITAMRAVLALPETAHEVEVSVYAVVACRVRCVARRRVSTRSVCVAALTGVVCVVCRAARGTSQRVLLLRTTAAASPRRARM